MSKKHFIALADQIRHTVMNSSLNVETKDYVIRILADFCTSQNPRFNRSRWIDYVNGICGPNGGKAKVRT